jgi:8-oxo-dGTP pyrophosphatase MutT (NUDIX family)
VTACGARAGRWGYRLALLLLRAWWFLARPRSAGVRCVLRHRDRILLVRHTYGDRRWMLPGGRVRRGEQPLDTARREMRAELGLEASDWRVVARLPTRAGYRRRSRSDAYRRHTTHYLAADASSEALRPRAAEIADAGWFVRAALPADHAEAVELALARGWLDPQPPGGQAGNCSSTQSGPSTGRRYERPPTGT